MHVARRRRMWGRGRVSANNAAKSKDCPNIVGRRSVKDGSGWGKEEEGGLTSRTSFLSSSDLSHEDPFAPEKSPVKGSWAISVGESMARKARLGDNLYERTFGSFFRRKYCSHFYRRSRTSCFLISPKLALFARVFTFVEITLSPTMWVKRFIYIYIFRRCSLQNP